MLLKWLVRLRVQGFHFCVGQLFLGYFEFSCHAYTNSLSLLIVAENVSWLPVTKAHVQLTPQAAMKLKVR